MKNSILFIGMFMILSMTFPEAIIISQPLDFIPRTIYYQDLDGDGYGNPLKAIHSTIQPKGYVRVAGDCDDTDKKITTDILFSFYPDKDHDGLGDGFNEIKTCSKPYGYVTNSDDCDDNDNTVGAGVINSYFRDLDGDGYGDANFVKFSCRPPKGYVDNFSDCDDSDPKVHEGYLMNAFPDEDADGFGNGNEIRFFCTIPKGWVTNGTDCDDHDPTSGQGDFKTFYKDNDKDGYGDRQLAIFACEAPSGFVLVTDYKLFDCDDDDKSTGPGNLKLFWIDKDRDGLGDVGHSVLSCQALKGYVDNYNDCNDSDPKIGGDKDYYFWDLDQDGYGGEVYGYSCYPGKGFTTVKGDCDDHDPEIHGESFYYYDLDQDGYGGVGFGYTCKPEKGFVTIGGDCNDKDPNIHPGSKETCNGLDDNCNGSIDEGDVDVRIDGVINGYWASGYLCADAKPVVLTGSPTGGVFSIDGNPANVLHPSNFKYDGIHKIEYAVSVNGCITKVYAVFKKLKVTEPWIYGLKDNYSQSDAALKTFPNDTSYPISGNSPNGVFALDGIKMKIFNPAALDTGLHKITFTIIEGGCQAETSRYVRILSPDPCPFYPTQGSCYQIINKKSHKVLTVKRGSLADGAIVTQSDFTNLKNQKWSIKLNGDGTYSIYSVNSLKPIEANSSYLGTAVVQKDSTSGFPSGSWKISCTERAGYYKIVSFKNGHVLDIMAQTESTGAQAITWYWTGSDYQYWQIVPVDCYSGNSFSAFNPLETRDQNQLGDGNLLTIYPNPAHDYITVKTQDLIHNLTVYDQWGRIVYRTINTDDTEPIKINLVSGQFSPGLYLIKANSSGNTISKKFIVN